MISFTVALNIADKNVEISLKQLQHGPIDPAAIAITMKKMDHWLARRQRVFATQRKASRTIM
jgi:hypothetical protein